MTSDDIKIGLYIQGGEKNDVRHIEAIRINYNMTMVRYRLYRSYGPFFVGEHEYEKEIGDLVANFAERVVHTFINTEGHLEIL